MCGKLRNEDKDNIHQDSDVCTIGVQNIMQSDHGTLRNQNKLQNPSNPMQCYLTDRQVGVKKARSAWCQK